MPMKDNLPWFRRAVYGVWALGSVLILCALYIYDSKYWLAILPLGLAHLSWSIWCFDLPDVLGKFGKWERAIGRFLGLLWLFSTVVLYCSSGVAFYSLATAKNLLDQNYSVVVSLLGLGTTLGGCFLTWWATKDLNSVLDLRITQIHASATFQKLASVLVERQDGLGDPPSDLLVVANRNSYLVGFWTDPFGVRRYAWDDFSKRMLERAEHPPNPLSLDLILPDVEKDQGKEKYTQLLHQLAYWAAESLKNDWKRLKRLDEHLRFKTAFCSRDISPRNGRFQTHAECNCDACQHKELCRDRGVLQFCLLIRYCDETVGFLKRILTVAQRVRIEFTEPDTGVQYPLLVLFDSERWQRKKTRAVMILVGPKAIQEGDFAAQVLFSYDLVSAMKKALPLKDHGFARTNLAKDENRTRNRAKLAVEFHLKLRKDTEKKLGCYIKRKTQASGNARAGVS